MPKIEVQIKKEEKLQEEKVEEYQKLEELIVEEQKIDKKAIVTLKPEEEKLEKEYGIGKPISSEEKNIEQIPIEIAFNSRKFTLIIQLSENYIEFKLNEKQVIANTYYFSRIDCESFLKLNSYFKSLENIKDIYKDLIILNCEKKLSLIEINDKKAIIELDLQIH